MLPLQIFRIIKIPTLCKVASRKFLDVPHFADPVTVKRHRHHEAVGSDVASDVECRQWGVAANAEFVAPN